MIEKLDCIAIWSENPDKLAAWYKKVFNLKESLRLSEADDTGVGFDLNGILLWFGFHSEITGKNKDPLRHIFEFKVKDLNKIEQTLTDNHVKIIRPKSLAPSIKANVITASDPEGNTIQFYEEI